MTLPFMPTKGPRTKRLAEARLRQLLFHGVYDEGDSFAEMAKRQVPDAWLTLEMDLDVEEPKEKVTLYLDRSVIKMFRAMGSGYQARINRLLSTWLQLKIAENVEMEMDMLEAIEKAGNDAKRPLDNEELESRRKKLHEYWAYTQGELDAFTDIERMAAKNAAAGK